MKENNRIETRMPDGSIQVAWTNSNTKASIPLSALVKFNESEVEGSKGVLKRWPLKILIELKILEMLHKHCDVDLSNFPI